ncbi:MULTISPECIES: hypothetical protein [unclassified Pseudactinotalea]|uniref:hypothetical protein n=1 Tax=unclassified Pseudactinotalea TaxID=2649176 RepID=UPI00128CFA12|nr:MULTISPECIES: hypothetical protein [unclassified Pseudactinotalea]MPV51138.1 hypothetical protein [Pseudactinotalea sp. HY160]QGH70330.1 hypothetical protein GCE65_13130 [Pseudactinotalea sp. HY158]
MHALTTRHALAAGALAAALLASLSGCESGDDGGSPTPPASPPASVTPSEPGPNESAPTGSQSDTASPTSTPTPTPTRSETGGTDAPIPTDAADYADALIVAWGSGDHDRMVELATPEVVEELTGHADPGGPHWDRVGEDSGAGSTFVRYEDTSTGETVELRVELQAAGQGREHAVAEVKFG